MSVQHTDERMNAITRMIATGESLTYACGMYQTSKSKYKLWSAGLSADAAIHSGEKKTYEETYSRKALPVNSHTKGHLQGSGGVRGHSAGDIFPYIIMVVGSFKLGFKYHLIGNGFKIGECKWANYAAAHGYARALLNPLLQ